MYVPPHGYVVEPNFAPPALVGVKDLSVMYSLTIPAVLVPMTIWFCAMM